MSEQNSWSKWFAGMVDPTAYVKTLAIVIRAAILILIISAVIFSVLKLKGWILNKDAAAPPVSISTTSGPVHNSSDKIYKVFGIKIL